MTKNWFIGAFLVLTYALMLQSCAKEDQPQQIGAFNKGVFVINEGPFTSGTGTVTFYSTDSARAYQDIYESVNGKPLGNVVQSMSIHGGKGYIVVNNASKVEIVTMGDFKSAGVITAFSSPRYFLGLSTNKAYVTDWDGSVKIINLESRVITGSIPCGSGPEIMHWSGKYVYVLNTGGFVTDSTITVIDPVSDKVVKTIPVAHRPTGIISDSQGKVWVLCSGKGFNGWPAAGDTPGKLLRINPNSLEVDFSYSFPEVESHPEKLFVDNAGEKVFFLYKNSIYSYFLTLTGTQPVKVVREGNYYAMGFDVKSGTLYVSDPLDYMSNGWVYRFKASDGTLIDSLPAGIIPGNFTFN